LKFPLILALAFLSLWSSASAAQQVHVIDGDTISIGEIRYRLHGIDAPESGQKCNDGKGGTWRCGDEATARLIEMVGSSVPECESRGNDDYGRVIAICWAGGLDLNAEMVSTGYAWAFRRYSDDYADIEDRARGIEVGIWRAPTQTAWEFRDERWAVAAQEAPEGCPIKGNISNNGHIYHAPWSPWYDRTKVSQEKGERWFCNELEAVQAGWRAPIWGR
jgi:endonuclease YncB( thermonuclease family)